VAPLGEVEFGSLDPHRFDDLLSPEERGLLDTAVVGGARRICGRRIWHVNSTARGGGVAEMLQTLLPYARGAGLDVRWLTIGGDDDFFRITKRIHNNLHGSAGDGGDLGDKERRVYEAVLARDAIELRTRVGPDDIVVLEDPQTAGLIPALRTRGVTAVWRCHVGVDAPNDLVHRAWRFLHPYVEEANAHVFSRRAYAWEGLDDGRLHVIPPCIDPFSSKNAPMSNGRAAAILAAAGLVDGPPDSASACVADPARVLEAARAHTTTPLVLQVSRWDRLKDPLGVLEGFVGHVAPHTDAHLLLAGPSVDRVADDPEGLEVFSEVRERWERLASPWRERVHLASLSMRDPDENARIVNALQTRADVVVQKSFAEGFGLTVAEAMWKGRPVVASGVGGITDQVDDGASGVLVDDPKDLPAFGSAVTALLRDPERARALGEAAHERVRRDFLGWRHLVRYADLITSVLGGTPGGGPAVNGAVPAHGTGARERSS
jgi:trehalose synthase